MHVCTGDWHVGAGQFWVDPHLDGTALLQERAQALCSHLGFSGKCCKTTQVSQVTLKLGVFR